MDCDLRKGAKWNKPCPTCWSCYHRVEAGATKAVAKAVKFDMRSQVGKAYLTWKSSLVLFMCVWKWDGPSANTSQSSSDWQSISVCQLSQAVPCQHLDNRTSILLCTAISRGRDIRKPTQQSAGNLNITYMLVCLKHYKDPRGESETLVESLCLEHSSHMCLKAKAMWRQSTLATWAQHSLKKRGDTHLNSHIGIRGRLSKPLQFYML